MMNSPWFIIADDFTGSGDSAVQFRIDGHPARLILGRYTPKLGDRRSSAIVVDSATRFLSGAEAYEPVRAISESLKRAGARRFFKKIDSTLRGNIADEIAAVMDGAGYSAAVVCPAAPRNGRTVVDGICLVDGLPVGSTDSSRDRFTPVAEARIASHFERRFGSTVAELPLSAIRSSTERLVRDVERMASEGIRVFIADAENLADLGAIARLSSIRGVLLSGSSGLAEALAGEKAGSRRISAERSTTRVPAGATLFIVGSLTPTSATQCERLTASGAAADLVLDSEKALAAPDRELARILGLVRGISLDRPILLRTDSILPRLPEAEIRDRGTVIAKFIGAAALAIARERKLRFIFASGGDTAAHVAKALGAERIDFTEELLPGLPYGRFRSAELGRKLYFASKSGGFGPPEALVAVLAQVARPSRTTSEERR